MVRFTINSNVKRPRTRPQRRERYNVAMLMKQSAEFQQRLQESFKEWRPKELLDSDEPPTIDELYDQLEAKTIKEVKELVGEKKRRSKRRCVRWFKEVAEDIRERRTLFKQYISAHTQEAKTLSLGEIRREEKRDAKEG